MRLQDLTKQPDDDTERPFWVWFADITAALALIILFIFGFVGAGLLSNKTDGKRHIKHEQRQFLKTTAPINTMENNQ